jgi:Na+-driven multidrug efflux pump
VAAIAVSVGAGLEVAGLTVITGDLGSLRLVSTEAPSQRALMTFFTPLLFVAFLPAVSTPLITATVARSPEADVSLAAFPLAMSVFTFVTLISGGVQPTSLSLLARGDEPYGVRRFSVLVGFIAMIGGLLVAWVPALSDLVVRDLLGADDRLAELTVVGLRIMSLLPPLMTVEQLYAAALLQTKQTRALVYVNAWRLLGLILFVVLVPALTDWSGAAVGAGAISFTLALEAVVAVIYGRPAFADLVSLARRGRS